MDDIMYLVSVSYSKDAYGMTIGTEERRKVFCRRESVTRTEFFEAGRAGLNPVFVFVVFAADYAGERECEYQGSDYAIYRTYQRPGSDYIELHVERKGGTNGQTQADFTATS